MSIKLPKHLVGVKFDELFSIEMNNFDVEMLLPALFWLVRSSGKDRGGSRTDAKDIQRYVAALSSHQNLTGFEGEDGYRLLDKWTRSSLIVTSAVGKQKRSEQIAYVRPLSFLAYKPSLPAQSSRLRQTHQFLYYLLNRHLRVGGQDKGASARLFDALVRDTFAGGVELEEGMNKDGQYDGATALDLEVLLQLYYLDGFDAPKESNKVNREPPHPACYSAALNLAQDVAGFLTVYARRIPTATLSRYLIALLNFELFIYTLRLMRASNALVIHGEKRTAFESVTDSQSSLELFIDCMQIRGSRSDQIAQACVNRDFEEMESFLRSKLMLRTLHSYVSSNRRLKPLLEDASGGKYIVGLWDLRENEYIQASARLDLQTVEDIFRGEDDNEENIPAEIRAILKHPDMSELTALVEILVVMQRKYAINNMAKWMADTGGLRRGDGLLRGNTKGRRLWRYVMSDALLETLVQLAVISPEAQEDSGEQAYRREPRSITLAAFLKFLHHRYGILIDTPPSFDQSTEATAAAKDNFFALKARLRQMGLFMDLSDDFNAQRIFPRSTKK
ncbi:MAG: hypothetical protein QM758_00445 [Armatimonas sp.]